MEEVPTTSIRNAGQRDDDCTIFLTKIPEQIDDSCLERKLLRLLVASVIIKCFQAISMFMTYESK
jgi:hypothetical protein